MQLSQRILSVLMAKKTAGIAYVSSTTVYKSTTVTYPTGVQAGRLAVLVDQVFAPAFLPSQVVPSGYTLLVSTSETTGDDGRLVVSYKVLTGAETGSVTGSSQEGINTCTKSLYIFDIGASSVSGYTGAQVQADEASVSVNTTTGGSKSLVLGIAAVSGASDTPAVAAGQLTLVANETTHKAAYGIGVAGQTAAFSATSSGAVCGASCVTVELT